MVHTIKLSANLSDEEFYYIQNKYDIKNENYFDFSKQCEIEGVRIEVIKVNTLRGRRWKLYLFADVIKLLGKSTITVEDKEEIISRINLIILSILDCQPELRLHRIDYRFDKLIESKDIRMLLIKLYNKNDDKKSYMKKKVVYNKLTRKSNRYCSLRYTNKSKTCNIYDKEVERDAKCKIVLEYEKNILRYEAQIKRNHIQYLKTKKNIEDKFENYFTNDMYNLFMTKVIISTIASGDYYNLYHASKKINTSILKEKGKKELIEFLKNISKAQKLSKVKKHYSDYKYYKFLRQLRELNINYILIPKNQGITRIENPIKDILI